MNKPQLQFYLRKWRNPKVKICQKLQELLDTIIQSITSSLKRALIAKTFLLTLESTQMLKLDAK